MLWKETSLRNDVACCVNNYPMGVIDRKNKRGKLPGECSVYGKFVVPRLPYQIEELYSFVQRKKGKCFWYRVYHRNEDCQENRTVMTLGFPADDESSLSFTYL